MALKWRRRAAELTSDPLDPELALDGDPDVPLPDPYAGTCHRWIRQGGAWPLYDAADATWESADYQRMFREDYGLRARPEVEGKDQP